MVASAAANTCLDDAASAGSSALTSTAFGRTLPLTTAQGCSVEVEVDCRSAALVVQSQQQAQQQPAVHLRSGSAAVQVSCRPSLSRHCTSFFREWMAPQTFASLTIGSERT